MTFYYDFALNCDLGVDTPQEVINLLSYIVGSDLVGYTPPPEKSTPFVVEGYRKNFEHHRNEYGGLFPGFFGSSLRKTHRDLITPGRGVSGERYTFSFRCVMQDDEFHDQWSFIAWLAPYTETGGWGFFYTNHTDFPNDGPRLFYFQDQKAKFFDAELTQTGSADQSGALWNHLDGN